MAARPQEDDGSGVGLVFLLVLVRVRVVCITIHYLYDDLIILPKSSSLILDTMKSDILDHCLYYIIILIYRDDCCW